MQMQVKEVNADLVKERKSAIISSEEFAEWWAGGVEALRKRRSFESIFLNDPEFHDAVSTKFMSYKDQYEHTTAKATKFIAKLREWHTREQGNTNLVQSIYDFRVLCTGPLATALFQQAFPLRLHFSMFLPAILGQGTNAQQREWLEKAWRLDGVIGTYAQTELGHGTFIRGLETRADYDVEREEFVLNTPTRTAYKWWPGGLGQTANMAVVMAQLYIKGKHYGLQPFLVRIRNEHTHLPEPGVDVGELGPKLGFNGANNGYLGFKNVRIPRNQMLMKNAQVLPDGTFVKGPTPILLYGTMVYVRVMIVRDASLNLLQAATIATRYSAVRRQSPIEPNKMEPQILDHVTQQVKILPNIAKGVFYRLAANRVWDLYQGFLKDIESGNQKSLPELHALSCCLKAVCSDGACSGIETMRRACGGNGYLSSANLWSIYSAAAGCYTYEGEYTVLLLQTARFLIKQYAAGLRRQVLPKSVTYLRDQSRLVWSKDLRTLVRALEIAATDLTRQAMEYKEQSVKDGQSPEMANNRAGIKLTKAAIMHGHAYLTRFSVDELKRFRSQHLNPNMDKVLFQLTELFVLETFLNNVAEVLLHNTGITSRHIAEVEQRYELALSNFRRNAVAVVDGFDFHDYVLGSTLGCYDGHVYERLFDEAHRSPLNQEAVNSTFHTHLKPLMKGKL